jgi:ADP-ribosylglycohydrolase
MTLFTAEGLLRGPGGPAHAVAGVARAYQRWLATQQTGGGGGGNAGWLASQRALHSRRAPGNTCLSALQRGRAGSTAERINDSKGCGGVMRVAPAGIAARGPDAFALGAECAAITHGNPTGYLPAGVLAMVVGEIVHGVALEDAVGAARAELVRHPHHAHTLAAMDAAVTLAARGRPTLETLGGAWVAEEALAIALCCALVATDVRDGLLLAVNHSGDADSTGAIAGNLLGAVHGVGAIPSDLLQPLELRDVITQIGHDLADVFVDGLRVPTDRYPPD